MLYSARERMREYRPDWNNFPVEQEFKFNDRTYRYGDTFVRAEAGADEFETARLYRLKFIGKPVAADSVASFRASRGETVAVQPPRPAPSARPPVRPAPPLPRGR